MHCSSSTPHCSETLCDPASMMFPQQIPPPKTPNTTKLGLSDRFRTQIWSISSPISSNRRIRQPPAFRDQNPMNPERTPQISKARSTDRVASLSPPPLCEFNGGGIWERGLLFLFFCPFCFRKNYLYFFSTETVLFFFRRIETFGKRNYYYYYNILISVN